MKNIKVTKVFLKYSLSHVPSNLLAIMAQGRVAKCPPQEGGTSNGEMTSRQEGKFKKGFLVLGGKREREREMHMLSRASVLVFILVHIWVLMLQEEKMAENKHPFRLKA